MKYQEFCLQPNWFGGDDPETPKKATATLTISDDVTLKKVVEINDEVYEFVAAVEEEEKGNIAVVVGEDLTNANAAEELVDAINKNSAIVVAKQDTDDDKELVIVSVLEVGDAGNSIEVSTDCDNVSWGGTTELSGGQYGTPCPMRGIMVKGENDYYFLCTKNGTKSSVEWKKFLLIDC